MKSPEQKLSKRRDLTFYLESLCWWPAQNKRPCPRFSSSPLWSLLIPKALSIPLVESLSCTKLAIYSKTRLTQWWRDCQKQTKHNGYQPGCPLVVWCSSAALCHCRGQLYSYCQAPTAENTKNIPDLAARVWLSNRLWIQRGPKWELHSHFPFCNISGFQWRLYVAFLQKSPLWLKTKF